MLFGICNDVWYSVSETGLEFSPRDLFGLQSLPMTINSAMVLYSIFYSSVLCMLPTFNISSFSCCASDPLWCQEEQVLPPQLRVWLRGSSSSDEDPSPHLDVDPHPRIPTSSGGDGLKPQSQAVSRRRSSQASVSSCEFSCELDRKIQDHYV